MPVEDTLTKSSTYSVAHCPDIGETSCPGQSATSPRYHLVGYLTRASTAVEIEDWISQVEWINRAEADAPDELRIMQATSHLQKDVAKDWTYHMSELRRREPDADIGWRQFVSFLRKEHYDCGSHYFELCEAVEQLRQGNRSPVQFYAEFRAVVGYVGIDITSEANSTHWSWCFWHQLNKDIRDWYRAQLQGRPFANAAGISQACQSYYEEERARSHSQRSNKRGRPVTDGQNDHSRSAKRRRNRSS